MECGIHTEGNRR